MLSFLRRLCSSTPFLVCLLLVWGLVLATAVGFYGLKERPDLLRSYVLKVASVQLPELVLSVNEVTPVLWPSPGVRLSEVLLRERNTETGSAIFANACTLHFRWAELLGGNVVPGRVALEGPDVVIRLPKAQGSPAELTQTTATTPMDSATTPEASAISTVASATAPEISAETLSVPQVLAALAALKGLTLEISHGKVLVQELPQQQQAPRQMRIHDLSGQFTVPAGEAAGMLGLEPGRGKLAWAALQLQGFGPALSINTAQLDVDEVRLSRGALLRTGSVKFTASLAMENLLRNMDMSLTAALGLSAGPPDLRGELTAGGTALINNVPVAVEAKVPFNSRDVRQSIDIRNAQLTMENNKAALTATWLADENSLTGRVDVTRLSLPRWFAFGRKLPAGLVSALDDISGFLTFRMNKHSLAAPEMHISLRGIQFKGYGGVDDFAAPVIRINAATDAADINRIFPELLNPNQTEPDFNAPPLLDGSSDSPDVGFDIRLKSEDSVFWHLKGREFELHLEPIWDKQTSSVPKGPKTASSINGTKINASWKQFYGGEAILTLRVGDEFILNTRLKDVRGDELAAALAAGAATPHAATPHAATPHAATTGQGSTPHAESQNPSPQKPLVVKAAPAFGGTLNATANLRGRGSTLAAVLAGLSGSLDATLSGGFFGQNKTRFASLSLKADNLRGQPAPNLRKLPSVLPYTARWQVALTAPRETGKDPAESLALSADATGRLQFSTSSWRPVSSSGLPFNASGRTQGLPFNVSGRFNMDSAQQTLSLTDGSGRFAGSDVSFILNGTDLDRSPRWKGQGSLAASNLRELLANVDMLPARLTPNALRRGEVRAMVEITDSGFRLDSLQGTVDDTRFSGSLARAHKQGKKHWDVNLQLGTLDADVYLGKKDPQRKATQWNLNFLRENTMAGEVRIDKLTLLDMYFDDFRLPVRLINEEFTASPVSAKAAGGSLSAMFRASSAKGNGDNTLRLSLQAGLERVNMHTLRREPPKVSAKDSVAGTGAFRVDLSGVGQSSSDIPGNINGSWAMRIDNGYFQSGTSRRYFHAMTANGAMRSGVLESSDLFVNGSNFTVRGGGSVNLVNNTLDYRLNASLPGIPNIPITYSGSIDDPQRNINAFSTLGGVFANVGKGLFSIVDQVISAPFRFLR